MEIDGHQPIIHLSHQRIIRLEGARPRRGTGLLHPGLRDDVSSSGGIRLSRVPEGDAGNKGKAPFRDRPSMKLLPKVRRQPPPGLGSRTRGQQGTAYGTDGVARERPTTTRRRWTPTQPREELRSHISSEAEGAGILR